MDKFKKSLKNQNEQAHNNQKKLYKNKINLLQKKILNKILTKINLVELTVPIICLLNLLELMIRDNLLLILKFKKYFILKKGFYFRYQQILITMLNL